MTEWRAITIEDLCVRVTSGGTPSRKRPDFYQEAGIPWFKSQELLGQCLTSAEEHLSEDGLKESSAKLLPPNTVLMAMYGANVGQLGWLGIEATVNQAVCAMVTDPVVTDARFLYYALANARKTLVAQAHGAAQQNLSQQLIKPFAIRVPDVGTQRRIGFVLRTLDDLIENNRTRIGLLEEMARVIYREWFVKFRFPGHNEVPLVDSELGPIPKDWDIQPFDEVADFINGFAFKPAHWGSVGRPIIKIKELKNGVLAATPRHPAEAIAQKFWVERGDLLFSWSADLAVYIWNDEPGLLNQHLFVVRPTRPNITVQFLFFALEEAMHKFQAKAQGTTMRHIKRSALTEVSIRIPGDSLLSQFADHVDPLLDEVGRLRQEILVLTSLRDLLLPRLVTGQIDISKLDLDVLLEGEVA